MRLGAWPPRAPLSAPRGDPFATPARPRAPRPAAAAPAPPAAPAVPPATPPMPYRVAGSVVVDGVRQVLLAKGDALFPVTEGDTLEGDYRVESIGGDELILVYGPLGVRESLPLAGDASTARIARVRWDGPEHVRAGQPLKVVLRVTSDEPLRAAPLELSFDSAVLEPVSVQPGKAFEAAGFAHRVVADGSILVGASGRATEPVKAPPDAELVVFVFKAVRPAAATELKLASLVLQGAVGKPLAIEPPGAYRAAIAP
jgi:Cohesin domain